MAMNEYGRRAQAHWRSWLPHAYAQIPDPETYFTELGERVATEIEELSLELAGDDPPGESYREKLGRLNMARQQAREQVVAEQVLLPPEHDPDENEQGQNQTS